MFENENLFQANGTSTGTPNSGSYADVTAAVIDQAIMEQKATEFLAILNFGWYREDCLVLWVGTDEKLQQLYNFVTTLIPDLKFTMEIGNQSKCFLDLRISLIGNKLTTTVYSKTTNPHLYLHADSCHKKSSPKGIQKAVPLRLRRICSSDNDITAMSTEYTKYLVNRRQDLKSVQQCFNNVFGTSRQETPKKMKPRNAKNLIVFSTSFNPHGRTEISTYYIIMII